VKRRSGLEAVQAPDFSDRSVALSGWKVNR